LEKLKLLKTVIMVQDLPMERYNLQVMLGDGSFADYEVATERTGRTYDILKQGTVVATFSATEDGGWNLESNPGNIDEDLQQRLTNQLNGYRMPLS
jgi:hypothetical protein